MLMEAITLRLDASQRARLFAGYTLHEAVVNSRSSSQSWSLHGALSPSTRYHAHFVPEGVQVGSQAARLENLLETFVRFDLATLRSQLITGKTFSASSDADATLAFGFRSFTGTGVERFFSTSYDSRKSHYTPTQAKCSTTLPFQQLGAATDECAPAYGATGDGCGNDAEPGR